MTLDADHAVACFLARLFSNLTSYDPKVPGFGNDSARRHVRTCDGPIRVRIQHTTTNPISDVTPDPHTVVTATVQCPHMERAQDVQWESYDYLDYMVRDLLAASEDLERGWAARVEGPHTPPVEKERA